MLNLRLVSIIVTGMIYTACNEATVTAPVAPPTELPVVVKTDSQQVQSDVADFLSWYKLNLKKATSFPILMKDSTGKFVVNRPAYTDYLAFMNSSGYLSARYIGYWQVFFKDQETQLQADPITTGTPEGFDFDFVLISQKPEAVLSQKDNFKYSIVSMSDSAALVAVKLPTDETVEYEVEMYKEKQGWRIGYISTPNYD